MMLKVLLLLGCQKSMRHVSTAMCPVSRYRHPHGIAENRNEQQNELRRSPPLLPKWPSAYLVTQGPIDFVLGRCYVHCNAFAHRDTGGGETVVRQQPHLKSFFNLATAIGKTDVV
jgi:hypothetical protein